MGSLTAGRPKCLVEIAGDETILSRQVRLLQSCGLGRVLVTTGPFAGQIEGYLARLYPGLQVEYVQNPLYESTNYIYSLLLAKEHLQEEILLLHGDLVFEESVLQKLLGAAFENAVLVNRTAALPEKDFKGRVEGGLVKQIAVDIFDERCAFLMPLYKLSREGIGRWLKEMESFERAGNLGVYAENALNNLLGDFPLHAVYFEEELCMEIDTPEDLERARGLLAGEGPVDRGKA